MDEHTPPDPDPPLPPLPSASQPPARAPAATAPWWRRCWCCTLSDATHCLTHCGYPRRSLCCFGCSNTTRAIFIGSGGVMAGLCYLLILMVILICYGTDVVRDEFFVTGFLVMGIVYLPMGLALIYSAQRRNPYVLMPWIVINFFFAFLEIIGLIVAPIYASKSPPPFCKKEDFAIAMLLLEIVIVGCRCYCIAVVTQYRRKLIAARAERRTESGRPFNSL